MANTMEKKEDGYDIGQVIGVVKMLSNSQCFYRRLLEQISHLQEYEPEAFEEFKEVVENQHFKDPVDVVLFFFFFFFFFEQ